MHERVSIEPLSFGTFNALFYALEPGQAIIYHTGFLARDRDGVRDEEKRVHRLGEATWEAWRRGDAHLLQRRVSLLPSKFEYIAVRR